MPEQEQRQTVKEVVELDKDLDQRFRKKIAESKGLHRGVLKESFEEAIELWIARQEQKKVKGKSE